jgi:hypothetical protein
MSLIVSTSIDGAVDPASPAHHNFFLRLRDPRPQVGNDFPMALSLQEHHASAA